MVQTEAHLPATSRRIAARKALLNPANLIPFPVLGVLALARHYHLVANNPLWLLLGTMVFTQMSTTAIAVTFPPGTSNAKPRLLLTSQIVLTGLCVYVNGWGALCAVGFVFAAATAIHSEGSRYATWAMVWTTLTVVAGELAIALGWAKTMVSEPEGHGLAILEVAGTCAVIWILAYNQREKERVEGSLRQSERRFRALVQHASDIILVVASDGTVSYASPAFETILGYKTHESIGMLMNTIMHDEDVDRFGRIDDETPVGAGTARAETRLRHHDGRWLWFEVTFTNLFDDPSVEGWVANLRDISERKQSEEALSQAQEVLKYEAAHDAMTGLLNRASFTDRVAASLEEEQPTGRLTAVLFIDLDHFKIINDSLGHAAGDELLVTVAQRLRHTLRPGDLLARFGGDEFVVLCSRVLGDSAGAEIAQRLISAVAEPILIGNDEVFVTASIGIAVASEADTSETLLRHADAAMYQAKHDGRARAVMFRPDHHGSAVAALRTGNDLHRALDRDELVLHYQPIIDLRTGRVIGFEALMRWNHPERGLLAPSEFIAFAEETGLIVPMGMWALETACRQTAYWQSLRDRTPDARQLSISVNLAARQVSDRTLPKSVAEIIDRTGIAADAVVLELTENTLMQDTTSTSDALHALRSQGVHLSIDDFGTGYSSLAYLKRFPVESLKIDRSFIDGLGQESEDTSIVEAIVRLAHALELSAVAEGLETPKQLETLRTLGCDFAQGYLIGHPLPAEAIGDFPADDLTPWQTTST